MKKNETILIGVALWVLTAGCGRQTPDAGKSTPLVLIRHNPTVAAVVGTYEGLSEGMPTYLHLYLAADNTGQIGMVNLVLPITNWFQIAWHITGGDLVIEPLERGTGVHHFTADATTAREGVSLNWIYLKEHREYGGQTFTMIRAKTLTSVREWANKKSAQEPKPFTLAPDNQEER